MATFSASDVSPLPQEFYSGGYGWYWHPEGLARILATAYKNLLGEEALPSVGFHIGDLVKIPAGGDSVGCHDTRYMIVVFVENHWSGENPSEEEVHKTYSTTTNAQFQVKKIWGGYQFYKLW